MVAFIFNISSAKLRSRLFWYSSVSKDTLVFHNKYSIRFYFSTFDSASLLTEHNCSVFSFVLFPLSKVNKILISTFTYVFVISTKYGLS